MIGRIFTRDSARRPADPVHDRNEKQKKLSSLLFYLLTAVTVCSDKSIILLICAFMGVVSGVSKFFNDRMKEVLIPPQFKFYEWWALKFLTPIQKCLLNRADQFDIDPVKITRRGMCALVCYPHFVNKPAECGFFYLITNDYSLMINPCIFFYLLNLSYFKDYSNANDYRLFSIPCSLSSLLSPLLTSDYFLRTGYYETA
ncbi:hypothetical protein ACFLTD_05100 [Elusimicrobiota bacterium]